MATTDDAVIRLRLDTSQAKADLRDFEGSVRGVTVGARAGAQGGSNGPGGGGGLMGMLKGLGPVGAAAGMLGGMFAAPIVGDALGGLNGYVGGFGHNVSEMMGLGAWNRNSKVRGTAEDRTVSQLGAAGNIASDEQIRGLYSLNKELVGNSTAAENRVRGLIGGEQAQEDSAKIVEILQKIYSKIEFLDAGSSMVRDAMGTLFTGSSPK